MPTAYIALGSNLGDREQTLAAAKDRLARLAGWKRVLRSMKPSR